MDRPNQATPCFAVVHFFLQFYNLFCSCAMYFAVVLKPCTIPRYSFADVLMKQLLCNVFCSCTFVFI
jgi:hypothetical protein